MNLLPDDDRFVHRNPSPLSARSMEQARDPRFFERHWNVWHDDVGDTIVALGGSWYPNLQRMETYAIVNHRGDHRSVRAMGPAQAGDDVLARGPVLPEVVEGLSRWRHRVEPGEWGFSLDLHWTDTHHQVYTAAWGPEVVAGERQVTAGFEGFGGVTGWIQFGDKLLEWAPGQAHGTRDRHWGIGRGVGGPHLNEGRVHRAGWKGGIWIDLGDVGLWGKTVLYPRRDPARGAGRVREIARQLRFEPDTHIFTDGVIDLTFDDGSRRRLDIERIGNQTAFMRCAFYGGTPSSGLHHGEHEGPDAVEWDRFDVTDPAVRQELSGLNEHHCRVVADGRTTTGILQPLEPDAYHACLQGKPGWSLLEA